MKKEEMIEQASAKLFSYTNDIHVLRQAAVRVLLSTIDDPKREGLIETPDRVDRMYEEIFSGYSIDPKETLKKTFCDENHHELVVVKNIAFYSHCEHHMVPFFGIVHVGYIPNGAVVGISKLARLVQAYAKRLQIQERMTTQIADTIMDVLQPLGAGVVIEAEHLCMSMRGVKAVGARTSTSAMRGNFLANHETRAEFYGALRIGGK